MVDKIQYLKGIFNSCYEYFHKENSIHNEQFTTEWEEAAQELDEHCYPASHFYKLVEKYSNRAYHNTDHIYYNLTILKDIEEYTKTSGSIFDEYAWNCIKWATLYHDYFNNEGNDEELSAEIATRYIPTTSSNKPIKEDITRLILATKHKYVPYMLDEAIICDADLAILGSDLETFDKYEENIRKEYAHVPEDLYISGRYKILEKFYNRGIFLYNTKWARERFGLKSISNLRYSMNKLIKGAGI